MRPFIDAPGKALIVGGTREICAKLYDGDHRAAPDWHSDELDQGQDQGRLHRRPDRRPPSRPRPPRSENKAIKARLKDLDDELEIVIVKDMMLTGFDAPPLHTLYLDRPLKGALLMQTLARVNRTFRGKQDGLLVAYAPLAENLRGARRVLPADQATSRWARRRRGRRRSPRSSSPTSTTCSPVTTGEADLAGRAARSTRRLPSTGATVNYLPRPRHTRQPSSTTARRRRRALPSSRGPAGPRLGAVLRSRRPGATCARVAVLRRSPRLDGQVRRGGPPAPRRARPRGHPAAPRQLIAEAPRPARSSTSTKPRACRKPVLMDLTPEFVRQAQQATNPHLAIEALRDLICRGVRKATGTMCPRAGVL